MRKYRTKGHEQVLYYVLESYSVWFLWQKFILFCQKLMTFLMHQGFINFFRLNSLNHIICWKCITSMFIWRNFLHCMKNIFFSLKFFSCQFFFFMILGGIYRVLLHFTHWWDHFLVISQFFLSKFGSISHDRNFLMPDPSHIWFCVYFLASDFQCQAFFCSFLLF